jgi:Zn-dependent M28 family amino/carboxypeptidase
MKQLLFFTLLSACCLLACKPSASQQSKTGAVNNVVPVFSSDSAYSYVKRQVDFGARVPNTEAHVKCAEYLSNALTRFGARVTEQRAVLTAFDGTKLNAVNIIASFNTDKKSRILLCAHWDSRPWSDHDPDKRNYNKAVSGANDGASGVGVLLEIARLTGQQNPGTGIDIIFFDAEDYGAPQNVRTDMQDSWCLGSQYWARNPHAPGYRARFGILLDMTGAPGATFYREQLSDYYAKHVVDKIWSQAGSLGFGNYFINRQGGMITDDHLYINQLAGIPCANIIQYDIHSTSGFGHYWHTVNDTMENIDKNTLYAVGTTVLHVIYNEK